MFSCVCLHEGRPAITRTYTFNKELSIVSGNEQVTLTCSVTGDDIAGGYWEKFNPPQNLSSMSIFYYGAVQLTITRAHPMHSGKYRCVVYSQWGMAHSNNVTVNVMSK